MECHVEPGELPTRVRFRVQAMQDELTRLLNLRALRHNLATRMKRTCEPFALILVDLDGFKEVNDRHGHTAGDRVLQDFARLFREAVGLAGTAYRVGGDEFVGVLEDNAPDAVECLDRTLHETIEAFDDWPPIAPEFSLGWAHFPHEGTSLDALQGLADARMYWKKRQPRP